jgi:hypothetical protein
MSSLSPLLSWWKPWTPENNEPEGQERPAPPFKRRSREHQITGPNGKGGGGREVSPVYALTGISENDEREITYSYRGHPYGSRLSSSPATPTSPIVLTPVYERSLRPRTATTVDSHTDEQAPGHRFIERSRSVASHRWLESRTGNTCPVEDSSPVSPMFDAHVRRSMSTFGCRNVNEEVASTLDRPGTSSSRV